MNCTCIKSRNSDYYKAQLQQCEGGSKPIIDKSRGRPATGYPSRPKMLESEVVTAAGEFDDCPTLSLQPSASLVSPSANAFLPWHDDG